MTPQLVAAIAAAVHPSEIDLEALQRSESEGLLGSLVAQRARLQMLSELCFEQGELNAATGVERAIVSSLELTSKLLGMIVTRTSTTNILISADYLRIRQAITAALRKHPEAAYDVAQAIAELETEAAGDITTGKKPLLLEASPC
jgi:hypothetical protein